MFVLVFVFELVFVVDTHTHVRTYTDLYPTHQRPVMNGNGHESSEPSVIVVGGGLAGLVAARHLAGAGAAVTLYERRQAVGGRVRTVKRDGFQFDRGFQVLFDAYPAVRDELDLEALSLRRFAPGACLAGPNSRTVLSDPLRDPKALPATLFNTDVTVADKLRVLRLRRRLAAEGLEGLFEGPDESIESFLRGEGFSEAFITNFAAPFYGGITLDRSLSTSSRVFKYTFRTLSAGSIAVPAAGMGAIPTQLAFRATNEGATLELGTRVTAVEADAGGGAGGADAGSGVGVGGAGGVRLTLEDEGENGTGADTRTVEADAAVIATDPPTAATLSGLETVPTDARSCVTQYYELGAPLDAGKRLLLNTRDTGPNQIVPQSTVAPEYAPPDTTLISGTFLGEREASDDELARETRRTLESWYPERAFEDFQLRHTERIPFAQFAQPPGIHEGLPRPRDPDGPVYLAGDYTQWSSIQGALESGQLAAKAVVADWNDL